ncbi:MAG TPA: sigma-70 family RNA polymerase sigma factor [Kofleriaceae bacterium]|nr:sigma-70 family RNA polymerase sigma factor [Kofleriaceae bacterium]
MTRATTDRPLIEATLAGDTRAFGALVSRYQDVAFAVAFAATRDAAAAEDAAQEALVVAWRRLGALADRDRFAPWLCGIVRNVAREARRHERRHAPRASEPSARLTDLPSPEPSPFDQAAASQALAASLAALGGLSPRYREPLILFVRLDRSHARVAATLGLSEEAVRQRLSRARRMLRDQLAAVERVVEAAPRRPLAAAVCALILARAGTASAAPAATLWTKLAIAMTTASTAVVAALSVAAWRGPTPQPPTAREHAARRDRHAADALGPASNSAAPTIQPSPPHSTIGARARTRPAETAAVEIGAAEVSRPPRPTHPRGRVRHGPAQVRRGRPSVSLADLPSLHP